MRKWIARKLFPAIESEVRERIVIELKDAESKTRQTVWKANCEQVFEIDGLKYYRFLDAGKIPLVRLEEIQVQINLLQYRLTKDELSHLLEIGEVAANKMADTFHEKKKVDCITTIGYVFEEIRDRANTLMFHPDILMQLAAYNVIREDEEPNVINKQIHAEKLAVFKEKGGQQDFFTKAGLSSYLPDAKELINDSIKLLELYKLHDSEIERRNTTSKKILSALTS